MNPNLAENNRYFKHLFINNNNNTIYLTQANITSPLNYSSYPSFVLNQNIILFDSQNIGFDAGHYYAVS